MVAVAVSLVIHLLALFIPPMERPAIRTPRPPGSQVGAAQGSGLAKRRPPAKTRPQRRQKRSHADG